MSEKTPTVTPRTAPTATKAPFGTGRGARPAGGASVLRGLPFIEQEAALAPGGALDGGVRPQSDGTGAVSGGGAAPAVPRFAGGGAGGGAGPQRVRPAVDDGGSEVAESAVEGERGPQAQVSGQNEAPEQSPYLPELDAKRVVALTGLAAVDDAVDDLVGKVIRWQADAWNIVFHATGADPFIGMTSGEWRGLFMEPFASSLGAAAGDTLGAKGDRGVGAAPSLQDKPGGGALEGLADAAGNSVFEQGLTGAGEQMVKTVASVGGSGKLSAILLAGFAGTGVPGLVLGTLVNVVWSVLSDLIFGDEEREKQVHEARADGAAMRAVLERQLDAQRGGVTAQWREHRGALAACVETTTDGTDLDRIAGWAKASLPGLRVPPPHAEALGQGLLARWRRQRANTEDEANAYTTGTAFDRVTERLPKEAAVPRGERFIDQAKFEWGRRGLDLDGPVARLEATWEQAQGLPQAQRILRLSAMAPIALQRFSDADVFARTTPEVGGIPPSVPQDLAATAREGGLALTCRVVLTPAGDAFVAERFSYDMKVKPGFHADHDAGSREGQPDGRALPRRWEEEV